MKPIGLFFLFFFLFFSSCIHAQLVENTKEVRFSGIVINSGTTRPLPNVTCRNGKLGTTTDETGRFLMTTQRGDTIRFTHIGFKAYQMVVPDTLDTNEYIMAVFLSPDTVMLSEAVVLRRFGEAKRQNLQNARNNMSGVVRDAFTPQQSMDAEQNQKRIMNDFSRSIEYKGLVDTKLGIGTQSVEALNKLKTQKKIVKESGLLYYEEIDLLKKIYYSEKKEKHHD